MPQIKPKPKKRKCANPFCDYRFVPIRTNQILCSYFCTRERQQYRYHNDLAYREDWDARESAMRRRIYWNDPDARQKLHERSARNYKRVMSKERAIKNLMKKGVLPKGDVKATIKVLNKMKMDLSLTI